jgi:hypothetical protein
MNKLFTAAFLILVILISSFSKDNPEFIVSVELDSNRKYGDLSYEGYYAIASDLDGNILASELIVDGMSFQIPNNNLKEGERFHLSLVKLNDVEYIDHKSIRVETFMDLQLGKVFRLKNRQGLARPTTTVEFNTQNGNSAFCYAFSASTYDAFNGCGTNNIIDVYLLGDYVLVSRPSSVIGHMGECEMGVVNINGVTDTIISLPDFTPVSYLDVLTGVAMQGIRPELFKGVRIAYRENDNKEYFKSWNIPIICFNGEIPDISSYFDYYVNNYSGFNGERSVNIRQFTEDLLAVSPSMSSDFVVIDNNITNATISSSSPGTYYEGNWGHSDFINVRSVNWRVIGSFQDPFKAPDIFSVIHSSFTISLEENVMRFGGMSEVHLSKFSSFEDYMEFYHYSPDLILSDLSEIDEVGAFEVTFGVTR